MRKDDFPGGLEENKSLKKKSLKYDAKKHYDILKIIYDNDRMLYAALVDEKMSIKDACNAYPRSKNGCIKCNVYPYFVFTHECGEYDYYNGVDKTIPEELDPVFQTMVSWICPKCYYNTYDSLFLFDCDRTPPQFESLEEDKNELPAIYVYYEYCFMCGYDIKKNKQIFKKLSSFVQEKEIRDQKGFEKEKVFLKKVLNKKEYENEYLYETYERINKNREIDPHY